jgi:secernin
VCDTLVALGETTRGGVTLFAKNSDREPDEVQNVEVVPAGDHEPGSLVRCTCLSIPQAEHTFRVLLCRPFHMFGAEMGVNEHGVVIGNEALFTREKPAKTGLTGMDLLRLALERSESARRALGTIIGLLETHGQGGNCGYRAPFFYMNGFLIADTREAYVLETVHSWWAWKRIDSSWSISNIISLEDDFDDCSPGLVDNAVKKGWCRSAKDFNFRKCYTGRLITAGAASRARERCSRELLQRGGRNPLTTIDFMQFLRHHGDREDFRPHRHGGTLCMHAADPFIRRNQTVGSLVAGIGESGIRCYVTGASNPCLSSFFPVFGEGTGMPTDYVSGGAAYDERSWWWKSERLHRRALRCWPAALAEMERLRGPLEEEMALTLEGAVPLNEETMDGYFERASGIVEQWGARLEKMHESRTGFCYRHYWNRYDKRNGIKGSAAAG